MSLFSEVWSSRNSGAQFSHDRQYRYRLWRCWGDPGKRVAFIGLNPSTADEHKDDPTIRRCIGFAKRWGFGAYEMLNLFGWRSTDPRGLLEPADPVGLGTQHMTFHTAVQCELVVLAWGSHARLRKLIRARLATLDLPAVPTIVLGLSKDGSPRHPLYLPYDTPRLNAASVRSADIDLLPNRPPYLSKGDLQ